MSLLLELDHGRQPTLNFGQRVMGLGLFNADILIASEEFINLINCHLMHFQWLLVRRSRLMSKLGVRDLPSLVKFALEHGLTSSK